LHAELVGLVRPARQRPPTINKHPLARARAPRAAIAVVGTAYAGVRASPSLSISLGEDPRASHTVPQRKLARYATRACRVCINARARVCACLSYTSCKLLDYDRARGWRWRRRKDRQLPSLLPLICRIMPRLPRHRAGKKRSPPRRSEKDKRAPRRAR